MGDMASKRNARDLWISKGHLGAAAVLCIGMTLGAYALGYLSGAASIDSSDLAKKGLEPSDVGVVELLDRIEGSSADPEGQHTLTYPRVLVDGDQPKDLQSTSNSQPAEPAIVAAGKVNGPVVVVGQIQRGEVALQMALKQMRQGKLVGRQVDDGFQTVMIAGFDNLGEAQRHLAEIQGQYPDLVAQYEIRGQ